MVMKALASVIDPELHINIVELGLIYDVEVKGDQVVVVMTLTTPGCPLAPIIDEMVKKALAELKLTKVSVRLVWEPAWNIRMMSEEAKLKLGMI